MREEETKLKKKKVERGGEEADEVPKRPSQTFEDTEDFCAPFLLLFYFFVPL